MKIDGFLIALAGAIVLALIAPQLGGPRGPLPLGAIAQVGVALVFFLHGANLSPRALASGAANWRLHLFVQGATFVLFPLLGGLIYVTTSGLLPAEVRLGFFFLCALSSTISSSIATVAIARGDLPAAIFNATLSGLIGLIVTPALVGLVRHGAAAELSLLGAIGEIAWKLLAPFVAGQLLRRWLAAPVSRYKPWIGRLDRGVIVLIVYTAFCNSTLAGVWSLYGWPRLAMVAITAAALLALSLAATTVLARRLGFARSAEITAVICGSQKSLANGAPIAQVLFAGSASLGAILLPLMIFHPLQLIVCSMLAKRYAERGPEA